MTPESTWASSLAHELHRELAMRGVDSHPDGCEVFLVEQSTEVARLMRVTQRTARTWFTDDVIESLADNIAAQIGTEDALDSTRDRQALWQSQPQP